jgi:hypothetical protein
MEAEVLTEPHDHHLAAGRRRSTMRPALSYEHCECCEDNIEPTSHVWPLAGAAGVSSLGGLMQGSEMGAERGGRE